MHACGYMHYTTIPYLFMHNTTCRSVQSTSQSEISTANQLLVINCNSSAVGGALGVVIVILIALLVLSLVGLVYAYRKMKTIEGMTTRKERRFSR